jgi:hypothetical protein
MRYWMTMAALLFVGCGVMDPPQLSLVREGSIDDARTVMYGLYQNGARVAQVEIDTPPAPDTQALQRLSEAEQRLANLEAAPQAETPAPTATPAKAAAVCVCGDGTPCTKGADGVCRKQDGTVCQCNTATPAASAPTVSPVAWPAGCSLEVWSTQGCTPCVQWQITHLPKLPAGIVRYKTWEEFGTEAAQKGVSSFPYFIIYRGETELARVQGTMSAKGLADVATKAAATPRVQSVGQSPTTRAAPVSARWSWLVSHMQNTHGQDCSHMTEAQMEQAHNAAHNVRTWSRTFPIKQRWRR